MFLAVFVMLMWWLLRVDVILVGGGDGNYCGVEILAVSYHISGELSK